MADETLSDDERHPLVKWLNEGRPELTDMEKGKLMQGVRVYEPATAHSINWQHWFSLPEILLVDALWLSMPVPMEGREYGAPEMDLFNKEFVERWNIAIKWIKDGRLKARMETNESNRGWHVGPFDYFRMAEELEWIDQIEPAHDPIFRFLQSFQALNATREEWVSSKPVYVTREQLGELFHGTREEWDKLNILMEEDIKQGRLSAEIAVRDTEGFRPVTLVTERLEIRNGWLGGGWVKYTIRTADAAAWFKGRYEIPADSVLGRLFEIPQTAAFLAPQSRIGDDWQNDSRLTKGEKQRLAILEVITTKCYEPMQIPSGAKGVLKTICESDYPDLFNGDTSFDNRWKCGIGKDWKMANHASYAKRGKQ